MNKNEVFCYLYTNEMHFQFELENDYKSHFIFYKTFSNFFHPDDDINGCNQAIQAGKSSTRKGSLCDRKKRTTVSLSVTKNGGGGKFTKSSKNVIQ